MTFGAPRGASPLLPLILFVGTATAGWATGVRTPELDPGAASSSLLLLGGVVVLLVDRFRSRGGPDKQP